MNNQVAIKLTAVSKRYTIHHEKPTLVEKLVKSDDTFWALKDVTLSIDKGQCVGIIGSNGSGKTTLLKTITRITTPTCGTVEISGKIVSLIDLEAGFHPDLTGIQNVYLNGMLLGVEKRDIPAKIHRIIQFSGIEKFIDIPLFTYSNGMKLRLGFSIAIYTNPDILILDEGISAGDINFQKKSHERLRTMIRRKKTIVIASHSIDTIKELCSRIIVMNKGTSVADGDRSLLNDYISGKGDKIKLT